MNDQLVDQQTIIDAPVGLQVYVAGENVPAESEAREVEELRQAWAQIGSAKDDVEARAYMAAVALRAWTRHNQRCASERRQPSQAVVKACIDYVVREGETDDGVAAWVKLDGDRPSERTVREYRGTARDLLVYLASRGISPAECAPEDMKAWKTFLQGEGAPESVERMRAEWFGRKPAMVYQLDWRGPIGWVALRGYVEARREEMKIEQAAQGSSKKQAAALGRLAKQAGEMAGRWRASLTGVMVTYAVTPLRPRCERYTSDTVSLRVTLARNFFKMAMSRQAASDVNPLLEVKVSKNGTGRSQKIISRFFSDDEVAEILALRDENAMHSPRNKAAAARDTAMIRLARNQGLRISEISKLDLGDFSETAGECGSLNIRHAKGDKFRTVFLTEKTRASLERWLQYRAVLNPGNAAMFVSLNPGGRRDVKQAGERINDRAIRDMFDEAQKRLGIKVAGRSVHGLRHSYATRIMMEDEGMLVSLSLSMGHSGPQITMGYVEAAQLMKNNPAKLAEI